MPNSLRSTVADLAEVFADRVLEALRSMSLDEVLGVSSRSATPSKGRTAMTPSRGQANGRMAAGAKESTGTRVRRSTEDMEAVADRIVSLLRGHKEGMRTEQIRAELGLKRKDIARPIALALQAKRITKKGQKRATTYFAK
jgi:hypothetical protein